MGVASAIIEVATASAAWEAQKRMIDRSCGPELPKPKPLVMQCPSCHSRQFQIHNLVRICKFCRSEV